MNKVKISVVGIGLMGSQHLNAIERSHKAILHSIVDINKDSRLHAKKYKVPFYKTSGELLKNNKPDAVIVATPNNCMKSILSFLKAKIPVLLEKPISDNILSAKKIINNSKKNKTHLLIGYHRRHNSIVTSLKKKIESGH